MTRSNAAAAEMPPFYIAEGQPGTVPHWTRIYSATLRGAKRAAMNAQTFQGTVVKVGILSTHGDGVRTLVYRAHGDPLAFWSQSRTSPRLETVIEPNFVGLGKRPCLTHSQTVDFAMGRTGSMCRSVHNGGRTSSIPALISPNPHQKSTHGAF